MYAWRTRKIGESPRFCMDQLGRLFIGVAEAVLRVKKNIVLWGKEAVRGDKARVG